MKILWHGIGPWHKTGYGVQTALFTPLLRDLGHDVAIAVMGHPAGHRNLKGQLDSTWDHPDAKEAKETGRWQGIPVCGPGLTEFGLPSRTAISRVLGGDPDLVLVLKDAWVLDPAAYSRYRSLVWLAFDCEPMGTPDRNFFARAPHVRAACTSLWGQAQAHAAGLTSALYVPSGIDTDWWTPGDRNAARDLLGLPQGAFIAGIDAQNIGPRKGWGEQLTAFAMFHGKHPGSLLLIHAAPENPDEGLNLRDLAAAKGITAAVRFGAHLNQSAAQMLNWYRSLDVLLQGSYGEGFGLPIVQAQACGVPVIGTRCSAITEKIPAGTGWLVSGQAWWNPHHQADWTIPNIRELAGALEKAHRGSSLLPPAKIREHALAYDAAHITREYWKPILEEVTADAAT